MSTTIVTSENIGENRGDRKIGIESEMQSSRFFFASASREKFCPTKIPWNPWQSMATVSQDIPSFANKISLGIPKKNPAIHQTSTVPPGWLNSTSDWQAKSDQLVQYDEMPKVLIARGGALRRRRIFWVWVLPCFSHRFEACSMR